MTLIEASRRFGGAATWHEWLDGALMHCDITGFTAMSESLASLGNEGSELVASILNSFFETMLGVADRWGGVQMKFGGDAMLLYFAADDGARRAGACGLEMQRLMRRYRRVAIGGGAYALRMRIGIHAGRFFSVSAGPETGPLQYLLLGRNVNETATIEALAKPGQVVVTEAAARGIGASGLIVPESGGVRRLRSIDAAAPVGLSAVSPFGSAARRYVLPYVVDAVDDPSFKGLAAEQRRVTSMFITLDGTTELLESAGEEETFRQVNAYVSLLVDAVTRHGGVVLGSDVADHGDKLIVLFGAPVLQEEHEASAVRCAQDLSVRLAGVGIVLAHRIGVNTGNVFAGEIGSSGRREYTVIGDAVNLAARLMAAASPGTTLVSSATRQRLGANFQFKRRKAIRVKGKSEPVAIFELLAATRQGEAQARSEALPFTGRAPEVALLLRSARRARRGSPQLSLICGDAGIGKTRLLDEVGQRLSGDGWRIARVTARSHTSGISFGAWLEPLLEFAGVAAIGDRAAASDMLRDHVARVAPAQSAFSAVLCDVLGLPHDDAALVESLDAKSRRARLIALIAAIIEAEARATPLLLVFDDAHWSDAASLELLAELLTRVDAPLVAFVASREVVVPEQLASSAVADHIRLAGLSPDEARELITPLVSDPQLAAEIVERAQGNPLFMVELAKAPLGSRMPESVNDAVLARLDALRRFDREVLRFASVIGPSFDIASLSALEPGSTVPDVVAACGRLRDGGFLSAAGDEYAFLHTLTREVAYETLLYADRRRLHRSLAGHIEREHPDDATSYAEVLLHHYRGARDMGRIARYGLMSADRAASIFATAEAVSYYGEALDGLDEAGVNARVDRSIVLERLGDALDGAGRHREAGDAYFTALSEWLARGSSRRARFVRADVNGTARESLIARKISVSYERDSDYEQALSWIETALERLPEGAPRVAAEVMASKSVTLFRKGMYAEAIDWGNRAVALARRGRDRRILAYADNMLANSYIEQGALTQAVRHLTESNRLYHELDDLAGQSAAANNLASCHQLLGNLDQALYHYQDALQADARLGNVTHAAIIHNNIGEVLLTLGRTREAREHLHEVLRAYRAGAGLAALTGLSEVNLSRCALVEGDVHAGESHARRAIRLLRSVGAQGLLDEAELHVVEVRLAQGKLDAAIRRCRSAIDQARASGARLLEARGLRLLGEAMAAKGYAARAREALAASVDLAHSIDASLEEGRALIALASLLLGEHANGRSTMRLVDRAEAIFHKAGVAPQLTDIARLRTQATTRVS